MGIRARLVGGLTAIFVLAWAGSAAAAAGDLDPTFGDGGKATFPQGNNNGTSQIGLQASGRIVAGITVQTGGSAFAAIGVTPQGEIDPSFGSGGLAQVDLGGNERAELLAVGPGDQVYAAGLVTFSGPTRTQFGLARFTSQGQLDTSFNSPNGFLASKFESLSASSADFAFGLGLAPDGSALVTGSTQSSGRRDSAVSRVSPEGGLDFGFGGDGGTTVAFAPNSSLAVDAAVQSDGRVVLGGNLDNNGVYVARLTATGDPDGSFANGAGKVTLPGTTTGGSLAIQPDGKLVVVGSNGVDVFVERLLEDGTPDDSFSGDGRATVDFGATDLPGDVALQPDGKIVIVGSAVSGNDGDYGVARLQPNGSPDTTFASGGVNRVSIAQGDLGTTLALQPDGKIVAGGLSGTQLDPFANGVASMIRLQGDPGGSAKGKCAGKKATVVGTNGKDKLKGTKKKDVISAGGGKDTVKGLGGNDLICGGKGKDKLVGGPGKDKLLGQQGNDKLLGGPGKDTLKGGPGKKDKVNGGPGKDTEKP
jgi:uncharacterized delta-60 repeat protein